MNPNMALARSLLGHTYLQQGMYGPAIAEFQQRTLLGTGGSGDLGQAYALAGRRSEALKEIAQLQALSKQGYVAPYNLAVIYASLGDTDQALAWLEKAYEDRSTLLVWIRGAAWLDKVRAAPRFKAILKRMGLE